MLSEFTFPGHRRSLEAWPLSQESGHGKYNWDTLTTESVLLTSVVGPSWITTGLLLLLIVFRVNSRQELQLTLM